MEKLWNPPRTKDAGWEDSRLNILEKLQLMRAHAGLVFELRMAFISPGRKPVSEFVPATHRQWLRGVEGPYCSPPPKLSLEQRSVSVVPIACVRARGLGIWEPGPECSHCIQQIKRARSKEQMTWGSKYWHSWSVSTGFEIWVPCSLGAMYNFPFLVYIQALWIQWSPPSPAPAKQWWMAIY
jgi:hypothetical protein